MNRVEDEGNRALARLPDLADVRWSMTNLGDGWTVTLQEFSRFRGATADEAVDAALAARGSAAPDNEEAIERGAKALYDDWLKTTTYFRDFEEVRESFEGQARIVLAAAPSPNVRERELAQLRQRLEAFSLLERAIQGRDPDTENPAYAQGYVLGYGAGQHEAEARVRELEDALREAQAALQKYWDRERDVIAAHLAEKPGATDIELAAEARLSPTAVRRARAALAASPRLPDDEGPKG